MPQQPKITEDAEIDSWALQVTEELNTVNNTPVDLGPLNTALTALTTRVTALENAGTAGLVTLLDTQTDVRDWFNDRDNPVGSIGMYLGRATGVPSGAGSSVHSEQMSRYSLFVLAATTGTTTRRTILLDVAADITANLIFTHF